MTTKYIDPCCSWPDPEPMPSSLRQVPELDYQLLPASIRDWVADIANRQGCPPEFPAVTALIHMGAILGRKIGVRPKRHGDQWTVVPNLWGAAVGPPSLMKSPAIREARIPFKKVEKRILEDTEQEQVELREEYKSMLMEYEAETSALKDGWKALKTGKKTRGGELPDRHELNTRSADLSNMETELESLKCRAFAECRIEVNDPTPEALQVVLSNNPNGILYFNDELTSWLEALSKPGREGSRQMHLEMADGTDSGTVDRIGRGHIDYNKIESIFGSIQPGPLGHMVDKALSQNRANDGLVQRFQLLVWRHSFVGEPKDSAPDIRAAYQAEEAFMRLYEITPASVGCHDGHIPYLMLSPSAYTLWWGWYENLQHTARRYPEALTSHMMKYPSLIPSLALIDHLADGGAGEVGGVSMRRAFGLMEWLWEHAQRVYSAAGHAERSRLHALAKRIQDRRLDERFTLRDLKRSGWGIIKDDGQVLLGELVKMNWLSHSVEGNPKGGPKSDVFTVNPKVYKIPDLPEVLPKLTQPSYNSYDSRNGKAEKMVSEDQPTNSALNSQPQHTKNASCVGDTEYF